MLIALGMLFPMSLFFGPATASIDVPARARPGIPFDLAFGESVEVEGTGVTVKFLNVTEDSRCPADAICIWAGQVSILVGVIASGTDPENFVLTSGAGSDVSLSERQVGDYMLKLTGVQPYPVSSQQIQPSEYVATLVLSEDDGGSITARAVYVGAINEVSAIARFISAWSLERGNGTAIFAMRDEDRLQRVTMGFLPFSAECAHGPGMSECLDGQITSISGDSGIQVGDYIHIEVDGDRQAILISFKSPVTGNVTISDSAVTEYGLEIRKFREVEKPFAPEDGNSTVVRLAEGQREGPLLVQSIFPDRVEGLNYVEYPIAMENGLPITLRIGETASNGCTVFLTLVAIEEGSAVFLKRIEEDRPCPICWYQLALMRP